jgi:hypothetical protein
VRRVIDGTIEIGDGTVTAPKMNVADLSAISANLGSIVVGSANIGSLVVGNSNIANNAVSRQAYSSSGGVTPTQGTFVTLNSLSITRRSGADLKLTFCYGWDGMDGSGSYFYIRLRRGSTTIRTFHQWRTTDGAVAVFDIDTDNLSGSYSYNVQVYVPTSQGSDARILSNWLHAEEISK